MTAEEFRQHGRLVVDWIARYLDQVEQYPVLSPLRPGEVRSRLPQHPPQQAEPFEQVWKDFEELVLPGVTHWQSPRFFGYFPCNRWPSSILGELLSAGLGVQGMLWLTSPACTELETHVLDWLVELLDLPRRFLSTASGGGVIQDTASSATLCAVIAARERATGFSSRRGGCPPGLTAYASNQAHSSVAKAMALAGLGMDNLRLVDVDASFALRPDALRSAIEADRKAGRKPFCVVATVGTTSSLAFDPLRPIGEICREYGLWLHVDAAMAGSAAICPEFRDIHDGLELADSYCFNPHKWLGVNFDCDCFYVADRESLIRAMSVTPEYLRNPASEAGTVFDYRDWQIPLGRRFRALKLWFVLRCEGAEGLRSLIRRHVALAAEFADGVRADPAWELAAPANLNLVCFRHRGGDAANQAIQERVNASGKMFLTHTRLNDRWTLRLCVGGLTTQRHHVAEAWQMLREAARFVTSS
ncbi:MAG: pyridoxal-dependent decarboxylase [Gemmatales bacterium]|nr:pyridoxal-dependent decarboxylase [Gemmatales bacterium]MDW8387520.1 pyridoxal-dependent decarboxylase [Gemmatales bacterium]